MRFSIAYANFIMNIRMLIHRKKYRAGLFLLCLAVFFCVPQAVADEVRVAWVADGDTVRLSSGEWVRLQGIDAPEEGHGNDPGQVHAEESTRALKLLVQGRVLQLKEHGRDRHGRILGSLRLADGADVARVMVAAGHAFYYFHSDHDPALRAKLLAAQRQAMDGERGFWPLVRRVSRAGGAWLGNRRSGRAFPAQGPEAARVGRSNRVEFDDLWSVFRAGYCPARAVSPWPRVGS